jgi:pimeloyl-ACP methyl ester carboxylesterase
MRPLAEHMAKEGYDVHVIPYMSTRKRLAAHARDLAARIDALAAEKDGPVHVVTHSMGGLVARVFLLDHPYIARIGRVVMIAPPNKGSELADLLCHIPHVAFLCVPLRDMRTHPSSTVSLLGSPARQYEIGIIAGGRGDDQGWSERLPGDDDGRVSVASTHLAGEKDHVTLGAGHMDLLDRPETAELVAEFVERGSFHHRGTADTERDSGVEQKSGEKE